MGISKISSLLQRIHIYMCVYIYMCVCVYTYVCVYIYYVCVCVCVCVCIYIYVCVCVYTYIYLYRGHSINKGGFLEKSKIIFFRIFFHKCTLYIVWNWFIVKIILISQKYLFWGYSKCWQIKQCSRLEQKSVIKSLVVEKCKLCEIYKIMGNEYG